MNPDLAGVRWRKNSHSMTNGNCVEVAAWRKASGSVNNGACVEVALSEAVLVRDSKDPDGPVLSFTPAGWAVFVAGIKGGKFTHC